MKIQQKIYENDNDKDLKMSDSLCHQIKDILIFIKETIGYELYLSVIHDEKRNSND